MKINQGADYLGDLISKSSKIAVLCYSRGTDAVSAGISMAAYIDSAFKKQSTVYFSILLFDKNSKL